MQRVRTAKAHLGAQGGSSPRLVRVVEAFKAGFGKAPTRSNMLLRKLIRVGYFLLIALGANPVTARAGIVSSGGVVGIVGTEVRRYSFEGTLTDTLNVTGLSGVVQGLTVVGNRIFIAQVQANGNNFVSELNTTTGAVISSFSMGPGGPGVGGLQALGDNGTNLLAYFGAGLLREITTAGALISSRTISNSGQGIDGASNRIFLANTRNPTTGFREQKILEYDANGNLIDTITTGLPDTDLPLGAMQGLGFDPVSNTLWVSTGLAGGQRIMQFSFDGTVLTTFPPVGPVFPGPYTLTGLDVVPDLTSQDNPAIPNETLPDGAFVFENVQSGLWFDPPFVDTFTYTMTSGSLFTSILDFPTGFDDTFDVSVNGSSLGTFGPGQAVDFVARLGSGVSSFTVSGISPLVDSEDSLGFPLKLAFNTPTASFVMAGSLAPEPVPEPLSLAIWALGGAGLLVQQSSRQRNANVTRPLRRIRPDF
ncbi:MAG: hypothetical protein ACT4QC_24290 [Planctomycetaceae bacterium]